VSLSIFNFRQNTRELSARTLFEVLGIIVFSLVYALLWLGYMTTGLEDREWKFIALIIILTTVFFGRRQRQIYLTIFISGFVFLLVGEMYLRAKFLGLDSIVQFFRYRPCGLYDTVCPAPYSPETYTGLKPYSTGMRAGEFYHVNNLGYIDKDRNYEKKGNTYRIVLCGTSYANSVGVRREESYPDQLEALLNERIKEKTSEVINISMDGYSFEDIVNAVIDVGLKFDPDMIIMEMNRFRRGRVGNARIQPIRENEESQAVLMINKPSSWLFFANAIKQEYLYNLLIKQDTTYLSRQLIKLLQSLNIGRDKLKLSRNEKIERIESLLRKVKSESGNRKIYLLAIRRMRNLASQESPNSIFTKLARQYGIGFINTYEEDFGEKESEMILYIGDRHPNPKAHRIFAEAIYRSIEPEILRTIEESK
jgi:hypothetical protein